MAARCALRVTMPILYEIWPSTQTLVEIKRAERRAKKLLRSLLTAEQRAEFDTHEQFTVVGSDGVTHTVSAHGARNVSTSHRTYEVYLSGNNNGYDRLIAQLLALQTNAKAFKERSC